MWSSSTADLRLFTHGALYSSTDFSLFRPFAGYRLKSVLLLLIGAAAGLLFGPVYPRFPESPGLESLPVQGGRWLV